jgi:CheY-like chemotaxis protein
MPCLHGFLLSTTIRSREILLSAGMDASFLTSSTNAAELLKREKYHAVFLDMHMPPPDGVGLARQIRASRVNASDDQKSCG